MGSRHCCSISLPEVVRKGVTIDSALPFLSIGWGVAIAPPSHFQEEEGGGDRGPNLGRSVQCPYPSLFGRWKSVAMTSTLLFLRSGGVWPSSCHPPSRGKSGKCDHGCYLSLLEKWMGLWPPSLPPHFQRLSRGWGARVWPQDFHFPRRHV